MDKCSFRRRSETAHKEYDERGQPVACHLKVATETLNINGVEKCFCKRHLAQVKKSDTGLPRFGFIDDDFLPERYLDKPDDTGDLCRWTMNLDGTPTGYIGRPRKSNKEKPKKRLVALDDKDRLIAKLEGKVIKLEEEVVRLKSENSRLGGQFYLSPSDSDAESEADSEATQPYDNPTDEETEASAPPVSVADRVADIEGTEASAPPVEALEGPKQYQYLCCGEMCDAFIDYEIDGITVIENEETGKIYRPHPDGLPKIGVAWLETDGDYPQ